MKKSLALMLALIMVLCMIPTTALAANGTGHQISVNIYKVVLDSSKPLGYQNPELVNTIIVTCQDATGHSGYNHSVYLKEFHPTKVGLSTTDWTGWQFDLYYTKGKDNNTFYNFTSSRVNATANVTGSEPYLCSKNFYLVYKEANPQPNQPTDAEIKGLVGSGNIQVKCTTTNTTHPIESYSLLDGSYTTGAVTKNGDAYTCTITVDPAKYVAKYNETNGDHTLNPNGQSGNITFEWKNNSWALAAGQNLPIIFTVIHNTQEPPTDNPPTAPKPENTSEPVFSELIGDEVVKVECTTTGAGHDAKIYGLKHDGYTVGEVQGDKEEGYTCDITVKPDKYVDQYNLDIGVNHTLVDSDQTGTIHLKYDEQGWMLADPSGVPVVFTVKCDPTQPPLDPITIEVSKKWDGDGDAAEKPEKITVQLWANGKEVGQPVTIIPDNEDTWFHRFDNMPAKDSNGNLINYTVTEENVPDWTPYYWTADKLIFRIHNVPTENTREIKVTKKVSGEGADKEKYFDFKVTLSQDLDGNGEIGNGTHPLSDTYTFGGVTFTNGEATFKLKHGESFTITGIPSHVQYLPLQYKVEEIAPSGYTVKVNDKAGNSINGDFTGTNAKTVNIAFENIKESGTNPTPTPGGGNGGGGHWHPTTTPVPVIVIPPKTGDMTIWQSILHFLGIR